MKTNEVLLDWRDSAQARAIAQQRTATFDRTLHSLLSYGAPVLALLGSTTFFASFVASPTANQAQIAGFFSLVAAAMAAVSRVRNLVESHREHRLAAAAYTEVRMRMDVCIAHFEEGLAITDAALDGFITTMKDLDSHDWAAPSWIYYGSARAAKKGRTS